MMLRLFVLAFIASELCATALGAGPEATPGEWKLLSDKDGVALYRRQRTLANETKAIGDIAASTDVIHALLDDVDSHPSYMPYLAESRILKRENGSLVAYERISAPIVSDRDYTIRVWTTVKKGEGGTTYSIRWATDNAAGPPAKRGVVRVSLCEGSWLLEPKGANSTHATYRIYSDSGGFIPSFIKNTAGPAGIRKLFVAIRKEVRNPKYSKKN